MANENFDKIALNFPFNSRVELSYDDTLKLISALLRRAQNELNRLNTDDFSLWCGDIVHYLMSDYGVALTERFYIPLTAIPGIKLNGQFYANNHVAKFLSKMSATSKSAVTKDVAY